MVKLSGEKFHRNISILKKALDNLKRIRYLLAVVSEEAPRVGGLEG
jgi:hypothetical protein